MRLKFSLRALFVATTIVAASCYWLMLPTIKAKRFAHSVATENYQLADAYFRDPDDKFLHDWNEKHWRFKAEVELEKWSFSELIHGERRVRLRVICGDAGPMRGSEWIVEVTRGGVLSPNPTNTTRGIGGGGIL